ncbi:MAG TPA: MBL fold metallo-hydrolase [Thermoleophilaceae bacterium]|nr:MBL fold metallo-hydrolase [Thermoleophilaceae bacterium]
MRAVSLIEDALLVTSAFWQTNAVALRAGGETVLVDSPYLPDELDALPGLLARAGLEPDGLLATHADFDHLLGRLAFPALTLGLGEESVARLRRSPGEPQRHLRDYDAQFYVERPAPLSLGQVQSLPVPGRIDLGTGEDAVEIELHPASGHTPDGMALLARPLGVLLVGDYVSSVEIPWISQGGSLSDYRATLGSLAPLMDAADVVVPGHGPSHAPDRALRLIEEDLAYLDALERGEERPSLPKGRDSRAQRKIHRLNLKQLA